MSLNVVPVCASCGNASPGVSISCTECLQVCCSACFSGLVGAMVKASVDVALMTARICRKCQMKAAIAERAAVIREVCPLHGRKRKLYCVNCSEGICGDCIELDEPHELHQVCNLATIYLEKASRVGAKLRRAEKLNDDLNTGTAVYRRNLELVEKEEDLVLKEIDAMTMKSKLKVSRITNVRKMVLEERLKVPVMNGETLADLRNMVRQLSPYEFLLKIPDFENKCDELITQKNDIAMQKFDDIHCDLIPQYTFTELVYPGFQNASDDNVHVIHLKTAYGIGWKFTIRKTYMLQVEANAANPQIQKYRHVLVVIIPHADYSKTLNQSFELDNQSTTFDVAHSSYLLEKGFCSGEDGDLAIRIGIRCLNAIVDRQLLNYQYDQIRDYLVMHFYPQVSELKNDVTLHSWKIKDDRNRCWGLTLQVRSNSVGFFVGLDNIYSVCSAFFIELKHTDPMKTINRRISKHLFNHIPNTWGWSEFIKLDTLTGDIGYHPDGNLHIRFGIRPLPSPANTSEPSAANA